MEILRKHPSFEYLSDVLAFIGVPAHHVAYDYMMIAVPLVAERQPFMRVYRATAEQCGTTWSAVERALRRAAEHSSDVTGADMMAQIYGNALPLDGVPTASQMLVTVARMWYGMLPYARGKFL